VHEMKTLANNVLIIKLFCVFTFAMDVVVLLQVVSYRYSIFRPTSYQIWELEKG